MSSFTPTVRRRLGGGLVLASAAALVISSLSSVPAGAAVTGSSAGCPTLTIDNPAPGTQLNAGKLVVSGAAFDPTASSGPGVGRVDFFYGFRENGGKPLGTAVPGQTNVTAPGQTGTSSRLGGFSVQLDFGDISRGDNLVGYAYSSSSGAVTTVAIPILVGVEPTPTPSGGNQTPVPAKATTSTSGCSGGGAAPAAQVSAPQTSSGGAPAAAAPPVSAPPAAAPVTSGGAAPAAVTGVSGGKPVLRLDNPKQGDVLVVGHTVLNGIAFDPAATSGSGVDNVSCFDNPRDQGGIFMGGGGTGASGNPEAFAIQVNVNLNQSGAHTLSCYAHSSVTGQEAAVSVPIFLGAPPTATPR
jgi:hypothetical protein